MNDDKIQGAKDILGNVGEVADEVFGREIRPIGEPDTRATEIVQSSVDEVEAMINAKVRSLSKPRSG